MDEGVGLPVLLACILHERGKAEAPVQPAQQWIAGREEVGDGMLFDETHQREEKTASQQVRLGPEFGVEHEAPDFPRAFRKLMRQLRMLGKDAFTGGQPVPEGYKANGSNHAAGEIESSHKTDLVSFFSRAANAVSVRVDPGSRISLRK